MKHKTPNTILLKKHKNILLFLNGNCSLLTNLNRKFSISHIVLMFLFYFIPLEKLSLKKDSYFKILYPNYK